MPAPSRIKARQVPLLLIMVAGSAAACHRDDSPSAPVAIVDGGSMFPDALSGLASPPIDVSRPVSEYNGMLTDAGTELAIELSDTAGSIGNGYWLQLDSAGNAEMSGYKKIEGDKKTTPDKKVESHRRGSDPSSVRQCVTRKIAPADVAQLAALIRENDFFSLQNGYEAPTDHGSVSITITLDGKKKNVSHPAWLDSGLVSIDRSEKVRLAAIEDGIASLSGARAWLQAKTPLDPCTFGTITPLVPHTSKDFPGAGR